MCLTSKIPQIPPFCINFSLSEIKIPSLVLRTEKKVAIDQVVYVMNIANKNGIKVVLAVDSP